MSERLPDERIIALYNARDEQAIVATAVKYGNFCMGLAYDILGSRPDAEECVNDTYLRAWNSIPPAKPPSESWHPSLKNAPNWIPINAMPTGGN